MIYTRKGDQGQTSLASGKRVFKFDERIDTYGTIDELISNVALVRDLLTNEVIRTQLLEIENNLFNIQSEIAIDDEEMSKKIAKVNHEQLARLESYIDAMEKELPKLHTFILPGGSPASSQCHISRCVCRRAERKVIHFAQAIKIEELTLSYLNRLSDYLFVLARKVLQMEGKEDMPWNPKHLIISQEI